MQAEIDLEEHEFTDEYGNIVAIGWQGLGAEIDLVPSMAKPCHVLGITSVFVTEYGKPGRPRRYFNKSDSPFIQGLVWSVKRWAQSVEGQKALERAWEDAREEAYEDVPTPAGYLPAGMTWRG